LRENSGVRHDAVAVTRKLAVIMHSNNLLQTMLLHDESEF